MADNPFIPCKECGLGKQFHSKNCSYRLMPKDMEDPNKKYLDVLDKIEIFCNQVVDLQKQQLDSLSRIEESIKKIYDQVKYSR